MPAGSRLFPFAGSTRPWMIPNVLVGSVCLVAWPADAGGMARRRLAKEVAQYLKLRLIINWLIQTYLY
jgi:hypothetical protein